MVSGALAVVDCRRGGVVVFDRYVEEFRVGAIEVETLMHISDEPATSCARVFSLHFFATPSPSTSAT